MTLQMHLFLFLNWSISQVPPVFLHRPIFLLPAFFFLCLIFLQMSSSLFCRHSFRRFLLPVRFFFGTMSIHVFFAFLYRQSLRLFLLSDSSISKAIIIINMMSRMKNKFLPVILMQISFVCRYLSSARFRHIRTYCIPSSESLLSTAKNHPSLNLK